MEKFASVKTHVMNFVEQCGSCRRKDIVKFVMQLSGSYIFVGNVAYLVNRYPQISDHFSCVKTLRQATLETYKASELYNHWSGAFDPYTGYFRRPSKNEPRFLVQDKPYGPYRVATSK
jgi:hypothetical protein